MRLAVPAPRSAASSILLLLSLTAAYWFVAASLARQWADDPNYAHGFFVLPMAAALAWRRRDRTLATTAHADGAGVWVVGAGAILYLLGVLTAELFTLRVSLVVVIAGIVIAIEGRERFRVLAFPVAFLLCMVPLPYIAYYRLTFPLQLESSRIAAQILTLAGMPLVREGNVIRLEGYALEVVAACSGLRSIMTLGTLGLFMQDWLALGVVRRLAFLLLVIPIAVGANVARLSLTAGIAAIAGPAAAESFLHELSGVVVFVTGVLALVAAGKGLEWVGRKHS
jgi:exosortase